MNRLPDTQSSGESATYSPTNYWSSTNSGVGDGLSDPTYLPAGVPNTWIQLSDSTRLASHSEYGLRVLFAIFERVFTWPMPQTESEIRSPRWKTLPGTILFTGVKKFRGSVLTEDDF
jgi:hypothetical protein